MANQRTTAAPKTDPDGAKARLASTGRNDPCPCGSGRKYKKCHLQDDEALMSPPATAPVADELLTSGWRMFEQRRPGAAEKEFRAALALDPNLVDATVGIGMARLQAGDLDGARSELGAAVKARESVAASLRAEGATDGFTRKEAQAYIRASHALGCLAYDKERYEDALVDLERVYSIDAGPVSTEARLIAGKALTKLGRPQEAIAVLERGADAGESAGMRAVLGMALAQFKAGDRPQAARSLSRALDANPHVGKALLGIARGRVDNLAATPAGSREEAIAYAQTYGDVWDEAAKELVKEAMAARAAAARAVRASHDAADAE